MSTWIMSKIHLSNLDLVALACGLLAFGGCSKKEAPKGPPPPPEVLVTTVKGSDVPITFSWLGTLNGIANVDVRARVQGYLTKITYLAGKEVKVGDVLFEIDPRPFQAALEGAQADLSQAEAVQLKAAQERQRQETLYAQKAASQRDRDIAVQNDEAAKEQVLAQKAALTTAKINLDFTKVTASINGIIGIPSPSIGDLIGPATPPLAQLSTVDPIKAIFQISEKEYYSGARLITAELETPLEERKDLFEIVFSDGTVYPHKGKFYASGLVVSNKTGTLEIETIFPNPDNVLRPGFFARVQGVMRTIKDGILVPQQAVIQTQGRNSIMVVGADNKVSIQQVKATNRIGSEWLIEEGLKIGDRIVVSGTQKARDGMTVVPKPWTPQTEKAAEAQPEAK